MILAYRIERSHLPCNRSLSPRISLLHFPHNVMRARNKHETSTITLPLALRPFTWHMCVKLRITQKERMSLTNMRFICMCVVPYTASQPQIRSYISKIFADTGSAIIPDAAQSLFRIKKVFEVDTFNRSREVERKRERERFVFQFIFIFYIFLHLLNIFLKIK